MKTSILYGNIDRPSRACLPSEVIDDQTKERVARFIPEEHHDTHSLDLGTMKVGPAKKTKFAAHIACRGEGFHLTRGKVIPFRQITNGTLHDARVIPQEYVALLDDLDRQIEVMNKQCNDTLQEAMRHGRTLKLKDIQT